MLDDRIARQPDQDTAARLPWATPRLHRLDFDATQGASAKQPSSSEINDPNFPLYASPPVTP